MIAIIVFLETFTALCLILGFFLCCFVTYHCFMKGLYCYDMASRFIAGLLVGLLLVTGLHCGKGLHYIYMHRTVVEMPQSFFLTRDFGYDILTPLCYDRFVFEKVKKEVDESFVPCDKES